MAEPAPVSTTLQPGDPVGGGGDMKGMDHGKMDHGKMDHGKMDHGKMDHGGTNKVAAAEMAAFMKAKPVFVEYCESCHSKDGGNAEKKDGLKHFVMDSYPFGGHHASEIAAQIRISIGATSKKATMPKDDPGSLSKRELALVLAWADAFDKAHPAKKGGHQHGSHDHGAKPKNKKPAPKKGHDHSGHKH